MPTYEYECDACGKRTEELQSFSAPPLTVCPSCQQPKLRRLIGTGVGVLFKGSGFYQTEYRSDSYRSAAKADQDAGKGSSAGADSSGDKGAAAAPSKGDAGKSSDAAR